VRTIFSLISTVATIYTLLCFVRILFTWFPQGAYNPAARFLADICDPYLRIFRGIRFLRINYIDFSPVLAFAVLMGVSAMAGRLALGLGITLGIILAQLVSIAASVISSLLGFLILLVIARLLVLLIAPHSGFQLWYSLDQILHPLLDPFAGIFGGRSWGRHTWTVSLAIGLAGLFVLRWVFGSLVNLVIRLLGSLPF
jgi:YggT family protein